MNSTRRTSIYDTDPTRFHAAPIGPFAVRCTCGYDAEPVDTFEAAEVGQRRHGRAVHAPEAVTVYTKPGCVQCTATTRMLDAGGFPYEARDVTTDADALATVKALGYAAAPVIVTESGDHWSGFRPDKIAAL